MCEGRSYRACDLTNGNVLMTLKPTSADERGFLMIEVLITMFILVFGLLGVVGLQARAQQAETESYERTQALMLLRDMADRMSANRANAASYVTTTPLGTGNNNSGCTAPATIVARDLCTWSAALVGAAEATGTCDITTGANCVGAMIGARGCVSEIDATNKIYMIEVVWQGLSPSAAPPSSVSCGASPGYGAAELRRAVTTIVQIGNLGA
jgi:type IV pilus assembly protein PilV